jgi:hypothetical protein
MCVGVSLQLAKSFTTGRTKANVNNPPAAVLAPYHRLTSACPRPQTLRWQLRLCGLPTTACGAIRSEDPASGAGSSD